MGFGPQKTINQKTKKNQPEWAMPNKKRPGTGLTNKRAEGPFWQTGKQSQGPEKKSKTSKQKNSFFHLSASVTTTPPFSFLLYSFSLQTPSSAHPKQHH